MGKPMNVIMLISINSTLMFLLANNSIHFFIIYVPSQQLQGQLQTQHSVYKQIQL
jgi:hypothetical protein